MNFDGMLSAPEWRVEMRRKKSLNQAQNDRQKVAYVIAPDAETAKQIAAKKNPEWWVTGARKVNL